MMFDLKDNWTLATAIQYVSNSYAVRYLTVSDTIPADEIDEDAIKAYAKDVEGHAVVAYSFVESANAFDNIARFNIRTTVTLSSASQTVSFVDKVTIDTFYMQYFKCILLNDLLQAILTDTDMHQIGYTQATQTIFAYSLRLKKYVAEG